MKLTIYEDVVMEMLRVMSMRMMNMQMQMVFLDFE